MTSKKNESKEQNDADIPFESILEQLEGLVNRLEEGNLPLEESLSAFEKGMALAAKGTELIDAAEKRVEVLLQREDGSTTTESFPEDDI
jgi:exodeoxyribonuclease VII small subunit